MLSVFVCSMLQVLPMSVDARPYRLPDTGQATCYSKTGAVISCSGEDGEYNINPMSYTDNGNGTVTDNNTGLVWQKCTVGQSNDATCSGTDVQYNWYQATGTYDEEYNLDSDVCGSLNTSVFAGYTRGAQAEWSVRSWGNCRTM